MKAIVITDGSVAGYAEVKDLILKSLEGYSGPVDWIDRGSDSMFRSNVKKLLKKFGEVSIVSIGDPFVENLGKHCQSVEGSISVVNTAGVLTSFVKVDKSIPVPTVPIPAPVTKVPAPVPVSTVDKLELPVDMLASGSPSLRSTLLIITCSDKVKLDCILSCRPVEMKTLVVSNDADANAFAKHYELGWLNQGSLTLTAALNRICAKVLPKYNAVFFMDGSVLPKSKEFFILATSLLKGGVGAVSNFVRFKTVALNESGTSVLDLLNVIGGACLFNLKALADVGMFNESFEKYLYVEHAFEKMSLKGWKAKGIANTSLYDIYTGMGRKEGAIKLKDVAVYKALNGR